MATNKDIQAYIKEKYGYTCKTCWIAHAKEIYGVPLRKIAHNRKSADSRDCPCPLKKQTHMKEAFYFFGML